MAKVKQNKSKYQQNRNHNFHSRKKQITKHLNFRINGQKISTFNNVKHLGKHYKKILNGIYSPQFA